MCIRTPRIRDCQNARTENRARGRVEIEAHRQKGSELVK